MKNLECIGHPTYCVTTDGKVYSLHSKRFLNGFESAYGYKMVSLSNGDGTFKQIPIHRVVAQTFIPNPDNKPYVNHKDGDKHNNKLENLEWVTGSENNFHAYETGLSKGKNNSTGLGLVAKELEIHNPYESTDLKSDKLEEEQVRTVCDLIVEGYRDVDISRMTGVNRRYITNIRHKEAGTWKHVIDEYSFSFKKEERLAPETVIKICEELQSGKGVMQIAREMNLDRKAVGNIRTRKTFSNLSCKYNFGGK